MKKKIYIQPNIKVMALQHQSHILRVSNVGTYGLKSNEDDIELEYYSAGGDQGLAW